MFADIFAPFNYCNGNCTNVMTLLRDTFFVVVVVVVFVNCFFQCILSTINDVNVLVAAGIYSCGHDHHQ